jgi:hypothetical protein
MTVKPRWRPAYLLVAVLVVGGFAAVTPANAAPGRGPAQQPNSDLLGEDTAHATKTTV